jgi:DNA-binding transcriptional LysR family regulator
MDTAHLALLRELADRGSVTEVARATGRTTSAVSQQLRLLQRDVGVQLLERSGRGVRLTDAGESLARTAVRIATAIAEAEADWDRYRQTASGTVRLAFFFSAGEILVPGLLDRMAEYPEIELITDERDVGEGEFDALVSDFDIVIGHRSDGGAVPDRTHLAVSHLLREPVDVAVALDHPLASRDRVTIAEVIDEPWIGVPEGFPLDVVLSALSMQAGRPPKIIFRTTHLPLAENLVASGHGIALLPRYSAKSRASGTFALLPLAGIRAGRHLEALSRPDREARRAVRLVLDALIAEAAAL